MTSDPRAALDRLIAALEAHLVAAGRRQGEADPAVVLAYQALADAFEIYDDSLYTAYDEVTPFVLYDDAADEEEDDEDDDEDDDFDDDDPIDALDDDEDDDEFEDGEPDDLPAADATVDPQAQRITS
jgi:hypothetical protein